MARILVIDDELETLTLLDERLRAGGHDVATARRAADGLRLARELSPDLVILELYLPDLGGTEVCRVLRSDAMTRQPRIVIVSARGEEIDRVVGFELGADDFVVKPFSVRELMLRVRAVLRRGGEPPAPRLIEVGLLRVDREAHRVWVADVETRLTLLELRLLLTLHDRRGRVQSRDALIDAVWGVGSPTTGRTVDSHVKRLREKLGVAGDYVETVRKVGYRFAEPSPTPVREGATARALDDPRVASA